MEARRWIEAPTSTTLLPKATASVGFMDGLVLTSVLFQALLKMIDQHPPNCLQQLLNCVRANLNVTWSYGTGILA